MGVSALGLQRWDANVGVPTWGCRIQRLPRVPVLLACPAYLLLVTGKTRFTCNFAVAHPACLPRVPALLTYPAYLLFVRLFTFYC